MLVTIASQIIICFKRYIMSASQMAPEVISSWPEFLLLKDTRFMGADKDGPIVIMLTVNRSLMSTEIVGRAESLNSLGAFFVIALIRLIMPVVMFSMTY